MELEGALLVGLGYFVMVGVGLEVEEVVEGYFGAFGEGNLVAEAEDFLVCGEWLAGGADWIGWWGWRMRNENKTGKGESAPSLLHAATKVMAQAMTEKARESFMMTGQTERGEEVVWCGQLRDLVVLAVMWHLCWQLKIGQRRGHRGW